jgi:N utilization substance protein B
MGSRRQAREMALQALYLHDTCGYEQDKALRAVTEENHPDAVNAFCRHLVEGVLGREPEIDAILSKYTENWDLRRMASVDRNILRLSAFEILSDHETPVSVIIDEAIEIAKTYSTEDSGKFVNGILDKVKQERKNPPPS